MARTAGKDAIALLNADYRKVEQLFSQFENTEALGKQVAAEYKKNGLPKPPTPTFKGTQLA